MSKITGLKQLKRRMSDTLTKTIPESAEKAVYAITTTGGALATTYVPVEHDILAPSQYRTIELQGTEYVGVVGYTANYAAAVHEASGTLKGKPRPSGKGSYWDPDGKPKFLSSAFDDNKQDYDDLVKEVMKL